MSGRDGCSQCAASPATAEVAKLRKENAELRERVKCLQKVIKCMRAHIKQAILVLQELARWLNMILKKTGDILAQPSGVPRGQWSFAKGAHLVAKAVLPVVIQVMGILQTALNCSC